jgi:hypothetical protein
MDKAGIEAPIVSPAAHDHARAIGSLRWTTFPRSGTPTLKRTPATSKEASSSRTNTGQGSCPQSTSAKPPSARPAIRRGASPKGGPTAGAHGLDSTGSNFGRPGPPASGFPSAEMRQFHRSQVGCFKSSRVVERATKLRPFTQAQIRKLGSAPVFQFRSL